jgi:hypothetical protein
MMNLDEALSDVNDCCPFVDRYGMIIKKVTWEMNEYYTSMGSFCFYSDHCGGRFAFSTFKLLEDAINWISNYDVVTKKRWTISREVLNVVLIPDVVAYILQDYVVDSE